MANINAKQDGNQTFSIYGISGTLGPTYGTAETRPLTVDETGALNVTGITGGGGTTVTVDHGTITITNSIGGGTQYTEGTVSGTLTGNAIIFNHTDGTLRSVTDTYPLPSKMYATGGQLTASNPNDDTPGVANMSLRTQGYNYAYDSAGTSWVRIRGDVTNGMDVDVTRLPNIPGGTVSVNMLSGTSILAGGTLNVGSISSVIPATGNTNLGAAVDAAAGATKTGVLAIGVRDDALTTLTPVDNDYTEGLRVDAVGAHWVRSSRQPGFDIPSYDTIAIAYPSGTTETYTYILSSGTLNTLTVTYSDTTKGSITSVVRT